MTTQDEMDNEIGRNLAISLANVSVATLDVVCSIFIRAFHLHAPISTSLPIVLGVDVAVWLVAFPVARRAMK